MIDRYGYRKIKELGRLDGTEKRNKRKEDKWGTKSVQKRETGGERR